MVEENVLSLCLQAFSTQGILKTHIIGCLKINGKKKKNEMPKKGKYVALKNYQRKKKFLLHDLYRF